MVHVPLIFGVYKGYRRDIGIIGSVTRRDVAVGQAPNKEGTREGVGRVISERGPCDVQSRAPAWCPESGSGLGQGPAIKAYRVDPRTHSACSHNPQEKPSPVTMKFFVSSPFARDGFAHRFNAFFACKIIDIYREMLKLYLLLSE